MTAPTVPHAKRPCADCPWRTDSDPEQFPRERWDALRSTVSGELGAPIFACHKSAEGKDIACAGWLAVEGGDHLGIRMALISGRLSPDVLAARPGWPELFESYAAVYEAKTGDPL